MIIAPNARPKLVQAAALSRAKSCSLRAVQASWGNKIFLKIARPWLLVVPILKDLACCLKKLQMTYSNPRMDNPSIAVPGFACSATFWCQCLVTDIWITRLDSPSSQVILDLLCPEGWKHPLKSRYWQSSDSVMSILHVNLTCFRIPQSASLSNNIFFFNQTLLFQSNSSFLHSFSLDTTLPSLSNCFFCLYRLFLLNQPLPFNQTLPLKKNFLSSSHSTSSTSPFLEARTKIAPRLSVRLFATGSREVYTRFIEWAWVKAFLKG